jgi:protoporphyrinogen oxidase
MAPPGGGSLYVELAERDEVVHTAEILRSLAEIGAITSAADVELAEAREIKYAYVVFDDAYDESTKTIHQWLKSVGVLSSGRYGAWVYNSMEDSIIQGMEAALWADKG